MHIEDPRLRPYQVDDVNAMANSRGLINANDMGLGKTAEGIIAATHVAKDKILVIAPRSVLYHWESQWKQWAPEYSVSVLPQSLFTCSTDVVIINYEKLLNDSVMGSLRSSQWNIVLADEGHRMKNRRSKTSERGNLIPSRYRWLLTGTPILNTPDDLYNLLHWIRPDIIGESYWQFVSLFCLVDETRFGRKIIGYTHDKDMRLLLDMILSWTMIRVMKSEVLKELPPKNVYTVDLMMDPKQKQLYRDAQKLLFDKLPSNLTIQNAAVHLLRLMQITSNPGIYLAGCPNPKFDYIVDLVGDNPEHSYVVFTKYVATVKDLVARLTKEKISAVIHIGELTLEDRRNNLKKFTSKRARVLVATIASCGQGVDGLQNVSDTAIFIDADWSPAINDQAEDRLCRLGQANSVNIQYLQFPNTVDRYVGKVLQLKEDSINDILGV